MLVTDGTWSAAFLPQILVRQIRQYLQLLKSGPLICTFDGRIHLGQTIELKDSLTSIQGVDVPLRNDGV